jgi:small subunit ribosomal protein S20
MANTPQAKKRIRRNANRAVVNGNRVGRIRTFVKKAEAALASGDKSAATEAMAQMQPELARGEALRQTRELPRRGVLVQHALGHAALA